MTNGVKTDSRLSPAKRELLARLKSRQGWQAEPSMNISQRTDTGPCALSFAQQRLWFLEQIEPGGFAYNVPVAVEITGRLNLVVLERVLNEIVRRHETLRTSFTVVGGVPVQTIAARLKLAVELIDLELLAETKRDAEARRLAAAEAQLPFLLERAPLLRVKVLRFDNEKHMVLLTMHHIIADGWSMGVLMQEMTALYRAFHERQSSPLPELPIQYADFALWQRDLLQGKVLEESLAYWKQQLGDRPEVLALPTDYPRQPMQTFRGAQCSFELPYKLTAALKNLSRQEGVTLFMTLLAAWQTLLARYSGASESVVGTAIANRRRAVTEDLIGFFVNTLVMRSSLPPEITFKSLLRQVQEVALGAYAHQDLPFEKLVEELHPDRSLSNTPLFQVMFALQNAPTGVLEAAGLELRIASNEIEHLSAKFDLFLSLEETPGRIKGTLRYNADLFDEATVRRLIAHFERLLEGAAANPEQSVWALPLLSEGERERLLVEWNDTRTDYPRAATIHELFSAQAAMHGDEVAVIFGEEKVTYSELNIRANRLAHYLQQRGVGPEVRVGICLERSVELLVALLAILKAGGAYLPLDPLYPEQRLRLMVEDANASLVITHSHLRPLLAEQTAQIVCLDADADEIERQSSENPNSQTTADNLAYVMYTSGSTGRPKGVSIVHRNVVRLVVGAGYASFAAGEVFLQLAPVSFDASTFEIWGSLLNGARLVVMPPETPTLEELGTALVRDQVTTLWLTAGLFHQMAEQQMTALSGVRQLLAGGDVLNVAHVRETLAQRGEGRLINGYGPTETTTFACCQVLQRGDQVGLSVPIGRPIANTSAYVLDVEMQAVPIGVVGELYIGGDGVGRGYLNQPELTAEKFIPHPFSAQPGERLYRTGDRTRYLADGRIEFCGRADEQVKVRGFRIEVGEIEVALNEHPAVRESVVTVREDHLGDKRLVAYLVTLPETANVKELRSYLTSRLPEYMVPSAFVELEELPLTPNGKVDRRALPSPATERPNSSEEYVGPRTPAEEIVAGIWSELLGIEQVGVHDNFFELGGHSLLGTQVMSRVREAFVLEIPLKNFFESPTIASLCAHIEEAKRAGWQLLMPPIDRVTRNGSAPLSSAQSRMWFLQQMEPESTLYNIPAAIRILGALNVKVLEESLQEIVRRHEVLRTTFDTVNGQPVQLIAPSMTLTLAVTDLTDWPTASREAEVKQWKKAEAACPFDLLRGPLLRAGLLRLSPTENVLLLTMQHVITDGWSMGIMIRETAELYEALSQQRPAELAELTIQYGDFAHWQQRQLLEGETLAKLLCYWKDQLAGMPPVLELPTDRPRPAIQSYLGAKQSRKLPALLTAQLKQLARAEGVTQFILLLAAFKTLLYRYTAQPDIVVGVGIANRNRVETENLIGLFTNTLVLRTDLSGNPSFRELLRRERSVAFDGYAHQDLPFEKLVEELHPERSLSHMPLFQVMFAMQNVPMPEPQLSGVTLSIEENESETSKFDLMLSVNERDEQLAFTLEYSTDLFNAETISRMLGHFETMLGHIASNADEHLSDLALITAAEKHLLLVEWNDTRKIYPRELCIHQIFEAIVQRAPDAVAVIAGDALLTYAQLNSRANRLAHYLRTLGVGPEVAVGVCLERTPQMIVALLAILKAGGAYVPLDPSHPAPRLALMLADANARLLLTNRELAGAFPPDQDVRLIDIEQGAHTTADYSEENAAADVSADNLAYIMYTSGSTGRPKGVGIPHHAVVRLVCNTNYVTLEASDYIAQASNSAFDAATFEIWGSLLNGARLVVIPRDVAISPHEFAAQIKQQGITVLFLTTALFNQVARTAPDAFASLRYLLFGGEAVAPQWVREVLSKGAPVHLLHVYGPTENTTFSSWYPVGEVTHGAMTVPIGGSVMNTQAYVLDKNMQPAPIGVTGDLYVGGEGLMRGYLNEPGLTAESLVPHPHSTHGGERLYRTGDVARFLSSGSLEFVGRVDSQVKIRGFRIETGEVEATLREQTGIEDCLVVVKQGATGDKRLVAYCVAGGDAGAMSAAQLREQLKERLPEYMVPSQFVMLEKLPLTPNGKLDWQALPEPSEQAELDGAYEPSRTPIEELLIAIWEEALGVKRVGIHDNFFELGGHSLLATQIITRARTALNVTVPLRHLFESPTVAEFARIVEAHLKANDGIKEPVLKRVARNGELTPLSFGQQRLWFAEQMETGKHTYNVPAAVRLKGKLNLAALERSCNEIVRRHEALRTVFATVGGVPMQSVLPELLLRLPLIDLQDRPESEREAAAIKLARQHALRPFNLASGPLFRALAIRLGELDHIIVLMTHHIISDGWSMSVLVKEIASLYAAFNAGHPSPLSELPIQYADFTLWQREWMQSEVLGKQLSYWKQQLGKGLRTLELPTDRPRPTVQSFQGKTQTLGLSQELAQQVRRLSRQAETTQFMTLLAAFKSLLYRYSGQEDIVIGTTVANRNRAETETLIGFFVNMLVLRTDLSGNPTFYELLNRIREVTLGAYTHQDLPFDKLVEALRPERTLSSSPLFQVVFGLQHPRELGLPELELDLTSVEIDWHATQFDLIVRVIETDHGLTVLMTYSTDLFEDATITRLLTHYEAWLMAVASQPEGRLLDIPLELDGRPARQSDPAAELPLTFAAHQFSFGNDR